MQTTDDSEREYLTADYAAALGEQQTADGTWCVVCGERQVDGGETCAVCAAAAHGQDVVDALKTHNALMAMTLRAHAAFFEAQAEEQENAADRDVLLALAADARACADDRLA